MNDENFEKLLESVREAGAIRRGEMAPARETEVEVSRPDIASIRQSFAMSPADFAALLGISVATLRRWEQGHNTPSGPARVLLNVAMQNPQAVRDAARPAATLPRPSRTNARRRVLTKTAA